MTHEEQKAWQKLLRWSKKNHGTVLWLEAGIMYRSGQSIFAIVDLLKRKGEDLK